MNNRHRTTHGVNIEGRNRLEHNSLIGYSSLVKFFISSPEFYQKAGINKKKLNAHLVLKNTLIDVENVINS